MGRCVMCKTAKVRRTTAQIAHTVAGHRFVADVPADVCVACGEGYYEARVVGAFELEVALALATAGETSGEAVRFMRKVAGFGSAEFASLLGVRPETVSRWEKDKRGVDRATVGLLLLLLLDARDGSKRTAKALSGVGSTPLGSETVTLAPKLRTRADAAPATLKSARRRSS